MANELDGFKVLRRIGKHADNFPDIAVDARKAARALVVKQLKSRSAGLKALRAIYETVGGKAFALLIDAMSDADIAALAARFDPHHLELKSASPAWRRMHIAVLANGKASPAAKPATGSKPKPIKQAAAKPSERLDSLAMAAVRKGR